MKKIFACCLLIYYIAHNNGDFICKNNETNTEYLIEDSNIDIHIANMTRKLEMKIDALDENSNAQFTYLKQQLLELSNRSIMEDASSKSLPSNCMDAMRDTRRSGIYKIHLPAYSAEPFDVACDDETRYGGWTVVLRRLDGSENFSRDWEDYKKGFGNLRGEFFIGLEKLHIITASEHKQELLVVLKSLKDEVKYAKYNLFAIDNEAGKYALKQLGNYNGDAGDGLRYHLSMPFTTKDIDNDKTAKSNCAVTYNGGGWFNICFSANLFGNYKEDNAEAGISWSNVSNYDWQNNKFAEMLIRPIN